MTAKPRQTMASRLNAAQVAISNSLSQPEIQAAVDNFGYDETKLRAGEDLYKAALAATDAKSAADGTSRRATAEAATAKQTAIEAYQAVLQVARTALGNDQAQLTALGVRGAMPRTTAAFLRVAYALFDNAAGLSEVQESLAKFKFDAARLQTERAKIEAFDQANQYSFAAKALAQQATKDRAAAMAALDGWLSDYLRVAKIALRGKRELLEAVGLTTRSGKTPAQRAAPAKAAATRRANKTNV